MNKSLIIGLVFLSTTLFALDNNEWAEVMPKFTESLYLGVATNSTSIIAVGERGHVAISNDYGSTGNNPKMYQQEQH